MGWRRLSGLAVGSVVLVFVLASCSQPNTSNLSAQGIPVAHAHPFGLYNKPVCPGPVARGNAGCTARVVTDKKGKPSAPSNPVGYTPQQIWSAYGFPGAADQSGPNGSSSVIAIVDAYDDPTAAADLGAFESNYQLEPCSLYKYDQTGILQSSGGNVPKADSGWALEISLDVQWACAMAPGATIFLVEANSSSYSDLMTAVQTAASLKTSAGAAVQAVSMSWGGSDASSDTSYDPNFVRAGVTFVASSGDNGAGVIYPASSPDVVGVGGTSLLVDNSTLRGWSESAWSGSGGGISAYEPEPLYQSTYTGPTGNLSQATGTGRGVPDVAYDADPSTGFPVYDSYGYQGSAGWFTVGGTSAGAPQWAALFALAKSGSTPVSVYDLAETAFGTYFNDIASGNDCVSGPKHGRFSSGSSWSCDAVAGYDFVTGLGTPQASALIGNLP